MRKRVIGIALVSAMTLALFGAGTASAAGTRTTTVNVVHGIPGLDVDVCVNGAKAIRDFNPGEVASGIELPAGRYDLAVTLKGTPCGAAVLMADDVGLWKNRNYTVIANLDENGAPVLSKFNNDIRETGDGQARLEIRHTAAAPAVNVVANGARIIRGTWFDNGSRAKLQVPEDAYEVKVTLPGKSAPVIGPAMLKLEGGYSYQVYAWGSGAAGFDLAVVPLWVGEK